MSSDMFSCSVWDDIDRRSFFENAILLSHLKYRSQGHPLRMRNRHLDPTSNQPGQADKFLRMTSDFLNDFALVASGPGGADNVTATCLELSADGQTHTLRMARNSKSSKDTFEGMEDIITTMFEELSTGLTISRGPAWPLHLHKETNLLSLCSN